MQVVNHKGKYLCQNEDLKDLENRGLYCSVVDSYEMVELMEELRENWDSYNVPLELYTELVARGW